VRVQRVVMPDGEESWTVLDDAGQIVAAAEAFLGHLQALDRSPTTVRAYAFSLRLWFEFLALIVVDWDQARAEHVSRFVAWLRSPAPNVVVLESGSARRSSATVNRHLAGLFSFYDYHARNGVPLAQALVAWRRSNRGGYKAFLHHVGGGGEPPPGRCGCAKAGTCPAPSTKNRSWPWSRRASTSGTASCWCCWSRRACV